MTRLRDSRPAAALTAVALALAAMAPAAPSGIALDCTADGYDVLLTNPRPETVEPGQIVGWEVRFARKTGTFEIEDALAPGGSVFISGALGSDYLSTPQPCTAVVL